jgi:hypothetical protein
MAISVKGQALAQQNIDNRKKFEQAQAASLTPPAPVVQPTPAAGPIATNTSAGLNVGGVPAPRTIISPTNTTNTNVGTTSTQVSGQTGMNSPFAKADGNLVTPAPVTSTPKADVPTAINDAIKQNQVAIKEEEAGIKKVQEANANAIKVGEEQTQAQIEAQKQYAVGETNINNQRIADLKLAQAEYEAEQNRQKDVTLSTVQPLLDKEKSANAALLSEAKVKADNAESQAGIDVETARINASMVFAKLGMSFSGSAVLATQKIATEGSMKIAELKSGNAYKYADLAREMSKVEIAHQLSVNKIISDANEKILNKRETTRKALTDVQSNILLTEKEKIERIAKLKNDYAKFRADTESSTLKATRDSNKDIESRLNDIIIKLDKDKLDAKQELTSLIKNGQWDNLSDVNKNKLAKRSGLTLGEIEGEKTSAIYASVNASLQAILGKDFIVTPKSSKMIYDSALAYVAMGDSVQVAIQKAINANIKNLTEYTESQKYQADTRALDLAKSQAAINSTNESIRASQSATRMAENKAKQEAKNPWTATGGVNEDGFVLMYNKDTNEVIYRKPEVTKTNEAWGRTTGIDLLDVPIGTKPTGVRVPRKDGGIECGEFANNLTGKLQDKDGNVV